MIERKEYITLDVSVDDLLKSLARNRTKNYVSLTLGTDTTVYLNGEFLTAEEHK